MKHLIFICIFILAFSARSIGQLSGNTYDIKTTAIQWQDASGAAITPSAASLCQNTIYASINFSWDGGGTTTGAMAYPLCTAGFTIVYSLTGGATFSGTPTAFTGVNWVLNSPTMITGTQTAALAMTVSNPIPPFNTSGSGQQFLSVPVVTPNTQNTSYTLSVVITQAQTACNTTITPGDTESTNASTGASCVLPIALSSFDASLKGEEVSLEWKTVFEENFENFDVLRSADARNFNKIGAVKGNNLEKQYSFMDSDPSVGVNYYKLQMNDKDGSKSFSDIKAVELSSRSKSVQAYPNPFSEGFTLSNLDVGSDIILTDIIGKQIKKIRVESKIEFVNIKDNVSFVYVTYMQNGSKKVEKLLKVY